MNIWWGVFTASVVAILACIFLMSLGYLLSRKVIQGSCGGIAGGPCGKCGKGVVTEEDLSSGSCS